MIQRSEVRTRIIWYSYKEHIIGAEALLCRSRQKIHNTRTSGGRKAELALWASVLEEKLEFASTGIDPGFLQ